MYERQFLIIYCSCNSSQNLVINENMMCYTILCLQVKMQRIEMCYCKYHKLIAQKEMNEEFILFNQQLPVQMQLQLRTIPTGRKEFQRSLTLIFTAKKEKRMAPYVHNIYRRIVFTPNCPVRHQRNCSEAENKEIKNSIHRSIWIFTEDASLCSFLHSCLHLVRNALSNKKFMCFNILTASFLLCLIFFFCFFWGTPWSSYLHQYKEHTNDKLSASCFKLTSVLQATLRYTFCYLQQ